MSILFYSESDAAQPWREAFAAAFPRMAFRVWPDTGPLAEVKYALVWKPPAGLLAGLPNLKAILWLGAGVDHALRDPQLPPHVPILRLVDAGFAQQMSEYALYAVLHFQREMGVYARMQAGGQWQQRPPVRAAEFPVGVMGLGTIGATVARGLAARGFPVRGWSRTQKTVERVECFHGRAAFGDFLGGCRAVINVLPLTAETENILCARTLAAMPHGSYVINIGRGAHLVEEDLLAALESGRVAGAMLDVFGEEPLPAGHPFWTHPGIVVTPHIAALTIASEAQAQVIENVRRIERGEAPLGVVDRNKGY